MKFIQDGDTIHLNRSILKNHTPDSQNTHWTISDEELHNRIKDTILFIESNQQAGYREGVTLVKIDPTGFFSPIIELKAGMKIHGEYKPRREGEEPRRDSFVYGKKQAAGTVFACLYHKSVLAEDNDRESDCDWEIVTLLASPSIDTEPTPLPVGTLISNHFHFSGGTATLMSDSEFVATLKKSATYWKNKIKCRPLPIVDSTKEMLERHGIYYTINGPMK